MTSPAITTVAVFGATGRSGVPFVEELLARDLAVRAQVRDPAKLDLQHPRLTVIRADALDPAGVREVVRGSDAVATLIGHVKGGPKGVRHRSIGNIIEAMRAEGVRRLASLTGAGAPDSADRPKPVDHVFRFIMGTFFSDVIEDARAELDLLRASGLDWTSVRAPRLTQGAAKGTFREGYVGDIGSSLARADLAVYLADVLIDGRFVGQAPAVSN